MRNHNACIIHACPTHSVLPGFVRTIETYLIFFPIFYLPSAYTRLYWEMHKISLQLDPVLYIRDVLKRRETRTCSNDSRDRARVRRVLNDESERTFSRGSIIYAETTVYDILRLHALACACNTPKSNLGVLCAKPLIATRGLDGALSKHV